MIHYASPYAIDRNIGAAYNRFLSMLPESDYACLTDGDTLWTTPGYGHQIAAIVQQNPDCRLFYATTNRIHPAWQHSPTLLVGDDIAQHRTLGARMAQELGASVTEVQKELVPGSGFLILVRKSLWAELGGFAAVGMLEVDWDFFRRAAGHGERILRMDGVYLYHWYRGGRCSQPSILTDGQSLMVADGIWREVCSTANQVPVEFCSLLGELLRSRPLNFMEIGTDRGGTFRAIGRTCRPGGIKISVDLPRPGFWDGFDFNKLHREMVTWFPGVHLIHADSHASATFNLVAKALNGEMLDVLFVDGDHSYEGVKRDFGMYGPLVRPGGLVAFHDIVDSPQHRQQGCYVSSFWKELRGNKREYVVAGSWGGIGIWVKEW